MTNAALIAVPLGVAAQICVSPIPEVSTVKVVVVYFMANCALLMYLLNSSRHSVTVIADLFLFNFIFLSTAWSLTAIRRLYFSPLSKLPGPKFAALTKLWDANEFRLGRASATRKTLHAQYGDIFRSGPNEVSINNVDAIAKLYKGKYMRGSFFEVGMINGEFNLHTTRDYKKHTPWRRIWEKAFVSSEFADYNPRVQDHVAKLMDILRTEAKQGNEVDFRKLMENLVFDIMADLAFGKAAGMQDSTGDRFYFDFMHKYMIVISVVAALRNVSQLLAYLPETEEVKSFRLRGEKMLADRQKLGSSRRDLFRHLLAEDSESGYRFTQAELDANAQLVIVAGADTTSTVMTRIFRAFAQKPQVLKKLQGELDDCCAQGNALTVDSTKNLPYLGAVVNEGLRLFNPVFGVQITTPSTGVEICGTYLPGNCDVYVPHRALLTDERYFPQGEHFIPERWTGERPELLLDRRAFIPFGYGVHSCVGKQLALNEMRLTLSRVVREFGVAFGELYDEGRFQEESKDYWVAKVGPVPLKIVAR